VVVVVVVVVEVVEVGVGVVPRMWGFPTIQALSLVAIMGTVGNDGSNNCYSLIFRVRLGLSYVYQVVVDP
jgi:hypothetical protein